MRACVERVCVCAVSSDAAPALNTANGVLEMLELYGSRVVSVGQSGSAPCPPPPPAAAAAAGGGASRPGCGAAAARGIVALSDGRAVVSVDAPLLMRSPVTGPPLLRALNDDGGGVESGAGERGGEGGGGSVLGVLLGGGLLGGDGGGGGMRVAQVRVLYLLY